MTEHNEAHRAIRRDAFLFAAGEVNSLRARIDRLERALNLPDWQPGYLDTHRDQMADALDPDDFADEAARSWDALAAVLPVEP